MLSRLLLLSALLGVLLVRQAAAQSLADSHFARNFCWAQRYDRDHLAAHPDQRVTVIQLDREPAGYPTRPGVLAVELRMSVRGERGELVAMANCWASNSFSARILASISLR